MPSRIGPRDRMLLAESEWVFPEGNEVVEKLSVRYRTVGDATLTGAVRSDATTVEDIIHEISASRISERGATRGDRHDVVSQRFEHRRVGRHIGLAPGMRLDVGVFRSKQLERAFDR